MSTRTVKQLRDETPALALTGQEMLEVVQDGHSRGAIVEQIASFYDLGLNTKIDDRVNSTIIPGLGETIDDRVAGLLVAGTNITISYNDGAGTLTINGAAAAPQIVSSFDTRAAAIAATIPSTVPLIWTAGYTTRGDGGGGVWRRVTSAPAHGAYLQSTDGAFWELDRNQIITPEQFGALGDSAADCTTAFTNLTTYINAMGAITVRPGKDGVNYKVLPDPLPAYRELMAITDVDGLDLDLSGCEIRPYFANAQIAAVCILRNVSRSRIKVKVNQVGQGKAISQGCNFIQLMHNCNDNDLTCIGVNGGIQAIVITRTAGSADLRSRRNRVHIDANFCSYGLSLQHNGDQTHGYVRMRNHTRAFPHYNVEGYDVTIDSANATNDDVTITVAGAAGEKNITGNGRIKYTHTDGTGNMGAVFYFGISQLGGVGSNPCRIENIDIEFDIIASGTPSGFLINSDILHGVPPAGHFMTGLNFRGVVRGVHGLLCNLGRTASGFTSNVKVQAVFQNIYHPDSNGVWQTGANTDVMFVNVRAPLDSFASEDINLVKQVGSVIPGLPGSGWQIPTGGISRATFDTATVNVQELAWRVKALIEDMHKVSLRA